MITKDNLPNLLKNLGFQESQKTWTRQYSNGASITVDFNSQSIKYAPIDDCFKNGEYPTKDKQSKGFIIHRDTTLNFNANENFVCLVCVHLLLKKGYEPKHIVFEPSFQVGHVNKPSYGDILVFDKEYKPLVLIENKTYGKEFSAEWNNMQKDGGQLFSYLPPLDNKVGLCEYVALFASDFEDRLVLKNHIITLKDNEKRISELEKPKTFRNRDSIFEVWNETYAKAFETKGIFEDDIQAYSIGKQKYTISDLKGLSHAEIRPIYHEFATILRNHAITDFEHSFYILIDLFLCKITDERHNPTDLQFYYKGVTRDTPKEYCSRLLKLYQQGKKDLFGVDVVNKEETDIRQIFKDTSRSLENGLFAGIKELFEEIKFYNIKKFNFIDVENKEEFELNFQIIIKITALIQDINLSNSETNHFFGDLFEGLLSKNVHQTEGQFFTPLPIVNFIIKSLPEFPNSKDIKVLDYACGAGHFLTEFIKTYPNTEVYGIEKSQPLSQVAKIATIINGAKENSHIVFKDALSTLNSNEIRFAGFEKESFDCIIANPPYSVKGFLSTLTKNERDDFNLMNYVDEKSLDSKRNIECFFIERANHFLKKNGIMAIVLPSSVLSNKDLYTKTRELLFENFNIMSIVSLGSRTFGSTGTNTIILFAQKVKKNSHGLVNTFIIKSDYKQYVNSKSLEDYLKKQNYNKEDYFAFMQDEILSKNLENHEIFLDYKKNFKTSKIKKINKSKIDELFKKSTFYKSGLKEKTKEYKELTKQFSESDEYKTLAEIEYRKQFISFAKEIEKDKLNTFIQIRENCVAILQSPQDKVGNKSNKDEIIKFLGYDWSGRKGNEGIKYIVDQTSNADDESDDEDSDIIESVNSIKFVKTPLYNPNDDYDCLKYAYALRKHICELPNIKFTFENIQFDKLYKCFSADDKNLHYANLSDMIDFSRTNFDKEININVSKKVEIKSKYELVKLGDIASVQKGTSITSDETTEGNVKVVAGGVDFAYYHNKSNRPSNTITVSASGANAGFVNFWNEPIFASDCITVRGNDDLVTKYLFHFLKGNQENVFILQHLSAAQPHVYADDLSNFPIPLPPIEIQKLIVSECEQIDLDFQNAKSEIENCNQQIEELMQNSLKYANQQVKLSNQDIFEISIGKRVVNSEMSDVYDIPVYSANVFEPSGKINKLLLENFNVDSIIWGIDGDWMVNVLPANYKFYPTDHTGVIRIKNKSIEPKYFAWVFNREGIRKQFSRSKRASMDRIEGLVLTLPSLQIQQNIVVQITSLENQIQKSKTTVEQCLVLKSNVLKKHLE